jgi:hypothetical protein
LSTQQVVPFRQNSAAVTREEFGATQTQQLSIGATAGEAIAAREQAVVQARYIMAMQRPRKINDVRIRLLEACKRPRFAETARYARPVGREKNKKTGQWEEKIATGPSIRFIEAAVQTMGNIAIEPTIVFDSPTQRCVRVTGTDLETNMTWAEEIILDKRVERKKPKEGQTIIGKRINSQGDEVYLVEASDDEMLQKQFQIVSKRARKIGERLIPADIIEECMDMVLITQATQDAEDPDAAKKRIFDVYAAIDVMPSDLEQLLGHSLDRVSPKELQMLRGLYASMKDGELSWEEIMVKHAADPAGSAAAADEIAQKKLAELNAKKQQNATAKQDNTGAPTRPAPPAAEAKTQTKPVDGAPEGRINETQVIKLKEICQFYQIPHEVVLQVLDEYRWKNFESVTADLFGEITEKLEAAGKSRTPAEGPESETKPSTPKFGGKK